MRKGLAIGVLVSSVLMILTSCSSTKSLEEDLKNLEGFTSYQFYGSNEERQMQIEEVNVTNSETDGQYKTVCATVTLSDELYEKTGEYLFYYQKESSQWILSDYELTGSIDYTVQDNAEGKTAAQTAAENYMNENGMTQYKADKIVEEDGQLHAFYDVDSQLKYCNATGQVTGISEFYYDEDGCTWDCYVNDDTSVQWNLEGNYGAEYVDYDSDDVQIERDICAFTIDQIDFDNNRVHIKNLDQYSNDYESASAHGGVLIRKGENFGWADMEIGNGKEEEGEEELSLSFTINADEIIFYPDEAHVNFGYSTDKQGELLDRDTFDKLSVNLFYYPKEDGVITRELTTRKLIDSDSVHRVIFYTLADITGEYSSEERKNKYQIDGKYTKLTGTVHLSDTAQPNEKCLVNIYGDGKKLYTFDKFEGNNREQDFTVDITGVKTLELGIFPYFHEKSSSWGFNDYYPTVYVNDVILEAE